MPALNQGTPYFLGTNNGLYEVYKNQVKYIPNSSGQVYSIQEINNEILVGHHEGSMLLKNESNLESLIKKKELGSFFLCLIIQVNF